MRLLRERERSAGRKLTSKRLESVRSCEKEQIFQRTAADHLFKAIRNSPQDLEKLLDPSSNQRGRRPRIKKTYSLQ